MALLNGTTLLLLVVGALMVVITAMAARRRLLFAMAWRNLLRRKSNAALVVAGLLIGTAIISGSLVMGDTLDNIFTSAVYGMTGETDEMVVGFDPLGGFKAFNESLYRELVANGTIQKLMAEGTIDGIAPLLQREGAVMLLDADGEWVQGEPRANLIGLDPAVEADFGRGPFADLDYEQGRGVALNQALAEELGAGVGDTLLLFPGRADRPADYNLSVNITHVFAKNHGDADLLDELNLFMELSAAQQLFGQPGQLNGLRISNAGGVRNGAAHTEEVFTAVNETLNGLVGLEQIGWTYQGQGITLMVSETLLAEGFYNRLAEREEVQAALPLLTVPVEFQSDNASGPNGTRDGNATVRAPLLLLGLDLEGLFEETLEPWTLYTSPELTGRLNLSGQANVTVTLTGFNGTLAVDNSTLGDLELPLEEGVVAGFIDARTARTLLFGQADFGAANGVLLLVANGTDGEALLEEELTLAEMGLSVQKFKKELLATAERVADLITSIFLVLGLFSIAAGVMLIINIFVMLASERKGEMGISRALGMQRRHLLQVFLFEGALYAALAAAVGDLLGIGVGYIIIYIQGIIFAEGGGSALGDLFTYTGESLARAFALGMLITTLTVVVASGKVSKLNIVAAIRNIPEGFKATANLQRLGLVGLGLGLLFTLLGFTRDISSLIIMGPCLTALGAIPVALRLGVSTERAMLVGGLATGIWAMDPMRLATEGDMTRFFTDGMLLVTGGLLVLLSQTDRILSLVNRFTSRSSHTALFKTALAYPLHNRFRTGMTLAMFALIIFTVTTISLWQSMFSSSNSEFLEQESGGYQIIALLNPGVEVDLETELAANDEPELQGLAPIEDGGVVGLLQLRQARVELGSESRVTNLYGVDSKWLEHSKYPFAIDQQTEEKLYARGFQYNDSMGRLQTIEEPEDIWQALAANDSLVVGDASFMWQFEESGGGPPRQLPTRVGDPVRVEVRGLARNTTLVGILQQSMFLHGLFVNASLATELGADHPEVYLLRLEKPSLTQSESLAKALEKEYILYGTETVVMEQEVNEALEQFTQIMTLVEGFLGLGLIVGIAGLGIIAVRAVHERFHEIGVMRAIGYTRRAVMGSFMVEVSFVALLGIGLGVFLGIISMYNVFRSIPEEEGFKFIIDWVQLTLIMALAYGASLLAAIGPSRAAARVAPAEALRYE